MADTEMRNHIIKMTALGRRFQLGNLYDYRKDRILPDLRLHQLWTLITKVDKDFKLKVIRPKSSSKWEHTELDAHSQASVLAGLIDSKYRGASNYLNDPVNPDQVTETIICRARRTKEYVDLKAISSKDCINTGLFREGNESIWKEATHVVVGITYGAEAYCVIPTDLDNSKKENESREEAVKYLSKVASQMSNALNDNQHPNEFKLNYSEEDRKRLQTLECRLYADIQTLSLREGDVFDSYKHCFNLVEQCKCEAVPIKILLLPLKVLMAATDEIDGQFSEYHDVDQALLSRCSRLWVELEANKAKAKLLVKTDLTINRRANSQCLNEFIKSIQQYQQLFSKRLSKAVDKVRENGSNFEVETTINIAESHLHFQLSQLEQWLSWKQSEIKMARKMMDVSGIALMTDKKQLDMKLVESAKYALVLTIPALDKETKKILKRMKDYLDTYKTLVAVDDIEELDVNDPWHTVHKKQIQTMAKIRELIDHTDRNKNLAENHQVNFFMVLSERGDDEALLYSVYRADILIKDNLNELPRGPTCVQVRNEGISAFRVEWQYENPCYACRRFVVQFRSKGHPQWQERKTFNDEETHTTIASFDHQQESTIREIRVAADTCIGLSKFSEIFELELMTSESETKPINIITTIEENVTMIEVIATTKMTQENQDIVSPVEKNPPMRMDPATRFAEDLVKNCIKIGSRNGMDLYAVPLLKSQQSSINGNQSVERYSFSDATKGGMTRVQRKTILVMGATGSGKTTLIDGMINYIFNVEREDRFRFQLSQEPMAAEKFQVESQTSCIKVYDIHHADGFRIPYSLTIIDTPGYGDTKGLERDKEITEMIRQLFGNKKDIQQLDVIGFVVPASLARLTPTQLYIFDSVLSIFGKDVKENINFLLTFADSQLPPVLNAISEASLPCPVKESGEALYHKFNNSGFFCSNLESGNMHDRFHKFFWDMGVKNFEQFFNVLATMTTKSLSLTIEVLEERKQLEATIDGLQPLIKTDLVKMEEMRKTKEAIEHCQMQIEANQNVTTVIEVAEPTQVSIQNGRYVTNCEKCHVTCHDSCGIPKDGKKFKCSIMDRTKPKKDRTCTICPRKCHWSVHCNQLYYWKYVQTKKTIESDTIKAKYEAAVKKKLSAEELIGELQKDLDEIKGAVLERVENVVRCIQRLDEIALRPNPFSTPQYIDLIIDAEQQEKRQGYHERIESLKKLRKTAELKRKIREQEPLLSRGHSDNN